MAALHECVRRGADRDPVRAFLWSARDAGEALRRQRERVEGLESRCARMTPGYGGARGGGGDGPEELWALLADEREKEARLAGEARACRRSVEETLEKLSRPLDREALRLRFVDGLAWPDVQRELEKKGFRRGLGSLPRIQNRALAEVGKAAGLL